MNWKLNRLSVDSLNLRISSKLLIKGRLHLQCSKTQFDP